MLTATVDTRAFDASFKRYMEFNKRALPEIVNTKAYFVARNAVNMTAATEKTRVEQELTAPSKAVPGVALAPIIVNAKRRKKGEVGLVGNKLRAAANKLSAARKRSVNYLRSGWIPAIKYFDSKIPNKAGAPKYKSIKTFGAPKGGAKAAKPSDNWSCSSEIWNQVTSMAKRDGLEHKGSASKVADLLTAGLQLALDKETASMKAYVEKKLNAGIKRFNSGR